MTPLDHQIKKYVLKPGETSRILEDEKENRLGQVIETGGTINIGSCLFDDKNSIVLCIEKKFGWKTPENLIKIKDSSENHIGNIIKSGRWGSRKYVQIESLDGKKILKTEVLGSRKPMEIIDGAGNKIGDIFFKKRKLIDIFRAEPHVCTLNVKDLNFERIFLLAMFLILAYEPPTDGM